MKQSGHLNPSEKTGTGCPSLQNMEEHHQTRMEVWVDNNNKGVVKVCEICMCLARGGVRVEGVSVLGFTNYVGTGGVLECVCVWVAVVWVV